MLVAHTTRLVQKICFVTSLATVQTETVDKGWEERGKMTDLGGQAG